MMDRGHDDEIVNERFLPDPVAAEARDYREHKWRAVVIEEKTKAAQMRRSTLAIRQSRHRIPRSIGK